jgi:hypothetical protein
MSIQFPWFRSGCLSPGCQADAFVRGAGSSLTDYYSEILNIFLIFPGWAQFNVPPIW